MKHLRGWIEGELRPPRNAFFTSDPVLFSRSGFAIDPTEGHFAGPVDSRNCERAEEIITRASKYGPVTLDGLSAKGAVARMICGDGNYINDYNGTSCKPSLRTFAVSIN